MTDRLQFDQIFAQGQKAHESGNIGEAEVCYIKLLEIAPGHPDILHLLGVLYGQTEHLEDAEKLIAEALKSLPEDPIYLFNYGNVLTKMKRWHDAATAFGQAAKGAPDHVDIAFNLALTHKKLGNLEEAERFFRQVLSLDHNHAHSMTELAGLVEKKGAREEAIILQEKANVLEPNIPDFQLNLGVLKLKQHQWDDAIALFEKALSLEKWHPQSIAIKAIAHFEKGEDSAALNLVDPSTKLFVTDLPLPSDVDEKSLIKALVNHPSCEWERSGTTTIEGAQTENLLNDTNPLIKSFVSLLTAKIETYIQRQDIDPNDPFLAKIPESWNYSIWATILKNDGHQIPHLHPSGWLSGVYYLEVPSDIMDKENSGQQGWIEFGAPGYGIEPVRPPNVRRIMPVPGKLIFFPSSFFHQTIPLSGKAQRISIAFDVLPTKWRS
ncbi:MAG: tetratricopeptide repeat protein [Alphaproteobacteria bacterium]|nr:tetratricopeptide repeat protein [Alphaproteobacteria bacterium]